MDNRIFDSAERCFVDNIQLDIDLNTVELLPNIASVKADIKTNAEDNVKEQIIHCPEKQLDLGMFIPNKSRLYVTINCENMLNSYNKMSKQIEDLKKENKILSEKIYSLRVDNEINENYIEYLEKKKDDLQTDLTETKKLLEEKDNYILELQEENFNLEDLNEELNMDYDSLEEKYFKSVNLATKYHNLLKDCKSVFSDDWKLLGIMLKAKIENAIKEENL